MPRVCRRRWTRCRDNRLCLCGRCGLKIKDHYHCLCDEGWVGPTCRVRCNLTCHNGGRCVYHKGHAVCYCGRGQYRGRQCEDRFYRATVTVPVAGPTAIDSSYAAMPVTVGVSVGTGLLVVTLCVVLIAVLWCKRSPFLMKIAHRFKTYDDNDERPYDAFISYKSSSKEMGSSDDELFLINKLLPKLEKDFGFRVCVHFRDFLPGRYMGSSDDELFLINKLLPKLEKDFGFRDCVHFRDFLPGRSISENVLAAVEGSHRTIMLISQEYIKESVWSRFEYEQAQLAVIQQKQRIIPVLMTKRDKLTIADPTLKLILASTTYLEIPDRLDTEEFWVRLRLSMPKKKPNRATSHENTMHV